VEIDAVETSETIAAGKRRGALSSMIHGKIDALPRHSLLVDRCGITGVLMEPFCFPAF